MWHTWSARSGRADAVVLAEHRASRLSWTWTWMLLGRLLLLLAGWQSRSVRRMTVGTSRLLVGRSARRRTHAGRSHRWAHVVGWTHRGMHAGPVAVALGRRWTGRATVAALVLEMLL